MPLQDTGAPDLMIGQGLVEKLGLRVESMNYQFGTIGQSVIKALGIICDLYQLLVPRIEVTATAYIVPDTYGFFLLGQDMFNINKVHLMLIAADQSSHVAQCSSQVDIIPY